MQKLHILAGCRALCRQNSAIAAILPRKRPLPQPKKFPGYMRKTTEVSGSGASVVIWKGGEGIICSGPSG